VELGEILYEAAADGSGAAVNGLLSGDFLDRPENAIDLWRAGVWHKGSVRRRKSRQVPFAIGRRFRGGYEGEGTHHENCDQR
jgi:hypothetical protein